MKAIEIWYHDPAEVDPDHSWIANSALLTECNQDSFDRCPYSRVLALSEYAQPDIILSCDGVPILSAELTRMNPSGHNLPQRFSCLVRAAELGVPSIFYYPEYARRSHSDSNPRYLNVRVPLGQLRLSAIYNIPSLSVFWPVNETTLLPKTGLEAHTELADLVTAIAKKARSGAILNVDDELAKNKFRMMKASAKRYGLENAYPPNESYRTHIPEGDRYTRETIGTAIDPPGSCKLLETSTFLEDLFREFGRNVPTNRKVNLIKSRELSLVYTGTPNKAKDGPEHPYPGYLCLLDILYLRSENGQSTRDRTINLVFKLPIALNKFQRKALDRPTGLNILMEFADIIVLDDAAVVGGFIRNLSSGAVLIE